MSDLNDQLQRTLGDAFTLERELGGGGMSRVFVALDTALHRRVVVKVLPPEMAAGVSVDRFKREIALAARLQHPHIVPLLTAGDTDGLPYFTMPFVEGESLRARLARGGELPVPEGLRLLREVASALDYAHEKGIVHRDIKPDNVLLSRGSAMVSDFGVAKALSASSNAENSGTTSLGIALGTPAYMSPEQAAASPNVDARADVYAFGIMAYELFAGRAPFSGRSPQAMLAAHVTETPESIQKLRPALPPALSSLIMRCLEKHPADRPQSAADIVHVLDSINTPSGGLQPTGALPSYGSATPAPHESTPKPSAAPRSRRTLMAVGFGVGILTVAIIAAMVSKRSSSSAPAAPVATNASAKSIAVVPFVGGDPKDEYFADGVADELTSMLARVPGLGVAARSSAFAFKGKSLSSRQIGESLHVNTVVEGTVRRAESRLRITASLIDVTNGLTRWSQSYDREPKDVFAVQQEIASKIAEQLQVTLGATTRAGGTDNLEAHDLYLQGRFHAAKLVEAEQRTALESYERALKIDSTFAAAWAGVAETWLILADDWVSAKEAYPQVEAAARRALSIDSTLGEAHAALGAALWFFDYDRPTGMAETERGVHLSPSSREALWYHGSLLQWVPRLADSALAVLQRAERLDPQDAGIAAYVCERLIAMNDPAAERQCRRAYELDPRSPDAIIGLAHWYRHEKQYEEALKVLAVPDPNVGRILTARANVYLAMGRPADVRRTLDELIAEWKRRYVRTDQMAPVYLKLGDRENAIRWLEQEVKDESVQLPTFPFDDPLVKDDPRVQRIAASVKAKLKPLH